MAKRFGTRQQALCKALLQSLRTPFVSDLPSPNQWPPRNGIVKLVAKHGQSWTSPMDRGVTKQCRSSTVRSERSLVNLPNGGFAPDRHIA